MRHQIESFFNGASATAGVATNSTADVAVFSIPYKAKVRKIFAVVQGTSSNGTAAVLHFEHRHALGADTTRGAADVGALSKTASVSQQGKMLYELVSATTVFTVTPGEEIVVEVATADGAANAMWVGIELERIPENPANDTEMIEG